MSFGLIVKTALQRAELPFDAEHLELARLYANDNISDLWYRVKADFRHSRDSITTVANSDEYVLNKLFDGFVPNSFRGPTTNPRNLIYKDPVEFFRYTRNYQNSTGDPNIFTFGNFSGVDRQLPSDSRIEVFSSLANKTTGTVELRDGSKTVKGTTTDFSLNDIGLRFRRSGEFETYKIEKVDVQAQELTLDRVYRGTSSTGLSYVIGDIGIEVSVQGFIGNQLDSEIVILNGENAVTTAKTFGTLTSISKGALTGGRITCRNTAQTINVAVIAPGEFEVERQTIVLWRIPDSAETLSYRFYMKHPILRLDTDRALIPNKYERLLRYLTEADLREWAGMTLPAQLTAKIEQGMIQFDKDANDTSLWITIPQEEGSGYGLSDINRPEIDQDFVV